jgi:hypothetical protein
MGRTDEEEEEEARRNDQIKSLSHYHELGLNYESVNPHVL